MANDAPPLIYVDLINEPGHPEPWRVIVRSGDNNRILFRSSERYHNRADALSAAQLAFGVGSNVYLREAEHGNVSLRAAVR